MNATHAMRVIPIKSPNPASDLLEISGLWRDGHDRIQTVDRHDSQQTGQRSLGGIAKNFFDFGRYQGWLDIGKGENPHRHAAHEVDVEQLDCLQYA